MDVDLKAMVAEPLLQFFAYGHLPAKMQAVCAPFADLAVQTVRSRPRNPERTVCLRHLLDAMEAAKRAEVYEVVRDREGGQ